MKSRAEHLVELKRRIAELKDKECKFRARRERLEARLKTLEAKDDADRDALILEDFKRRLDADPMERDRLRERLDQQELTDERRRLFGLPPKNNAGRPDAEGATTGPASDESQSLATDADGDSATTAHPDATKPDGIRLAGSRC